MAKNSEQGWDICRKNESHMGRAMMLCFCFFFFPYGKKVMPQIQRRSGIICLPERGMSSGLR